MSNPNKDKGDRAEREAAELLAMHLGVPARRMLGAGRSDDIGDIDGVPGLTVQVANWSNVAAAVSQKPRGCEVQRGRAGTPFAVTMVRLRGGEWRMVQTPDQFFAMYREATA